MAIEKKRLGNILINAGKINSYQLQEALKSQKILGKKLGEILVDSNIITEEEIIESIEQQTGIKKVDLNTITFDNKSIAIIPKNLCSKYSLIPFGFDNNKIKVAMSDPLNIYAIDDVAISTGFEIETFISKKNDIKKFIEIYYSSQQVSMAAQQLAKESSESKRNNIVNIEEIDDVKNAPVVKMVEYLFKNSIEMKASDIHIEPFENEIRIRYRIDGQLQPVNILNIDSLGPLITRIKILAGLNIAEKRIPQDGRIIVNIGEKDVDLRVSVLPVVHGEKVVIRILNTSNYNVSKDKLGINEKNLKKIDKIISNPYGIVLVTGPTGSGKSTTLYSILSELNSNNVNIVTVEDPVEYTLPGVNQVNVNTKAGLTFASGLRSILRQDPDIVMIGEIRDNETAEIAIKAAITGHLVLSTLHTNDAPSSIIRLIDMGIKPYLVSTSVVGIVAQRLVRKVCNKCKESYEASKYEKEILGIDENEDLKLYKSSGCGYCNNTGYSGRIGVYEVMEMTRDHREAINAGANSDILKDISLKNGMTTLGMECRELVVKGVTTITELATISLLKD
ncbi:type II secretion system protein GspE [Clostridium botulinum]|uniref:Type II secretion system protein GspE n=1 Tax=Clostridium botulinum TaxID=1491 RepID=A0A0L9YBZ3_CLOBO|nr:GspE/PulE family protein [Clostridium botulinum]KAI3348966.1 Flp pilus assembly complex ATPase component TadA [Clostridium botulinum]KOM89168.1 type II secretion system protein E [Clostridium botulinum]KOR55552.1 type II secretion system protein E [Clostridium botulinum]MBN1075681.1 type II/IV secretion system protein [Clostridium botulinum]MCS6112376.1 type II/IV secretion system protein [Clostridium botulinum]